MTSKCKDITAKSRRFSLRDMSGKCGSGGSPRKTDSPLGRSLARGVVDGGADSVRVQVQPKFARLSGAPVQSETKCRSVGMMTVRDANLFTRFFLPRPSPSSSRPHRMFGQRTIAMQYARCKMQVCQRLNVMASNNLCYDRSV